MKTTQAPVKQQDLSYEWLQFLVDFALDGIVSKFILFGKYCLINPLVFVFKPLFQGRPMPAEVISFALKPEMTNIESLGAAANGSLFSTDEGSYLLDCHFGWFRTRHSLHQS